MIRKKSLDKAIENLDFEEIPFPPGEIKRLNDRKWILDFAKKNGVGAEIGVFRGHFSEVLLDILKPTKLYLVDPWTTLGETFGWGAESLYTGFGKLTTKYAYDDTKRRVSKFKGVDVRLIEDTASGFLTSIGEKLDWAYLDASHQYDATLNELKLIDKVLMQDGIIMGDDWQPARHHKHHGVFCAVNDFVGNRPYEFVAAGLSGQWCIRRRVAQILEGVKIDFKTHSSILMAAVDGVRRMEGFFEFGGVVVLSQVVGSECSLWISDSSGERQVRWGIASPVMAKSYPQGSNNQTARFLANCVSLRSGFPARIYLKNGDGLCVDVAEISVDVQ